MTQDCFNQIYTKYSNCKLQKALWKLNTPRKSDLMMALWFKNLTRSAKHYYFILQKFNNHPKHCFMWLFFSTVPSKYKDIFFYVGGMKSITVNAHYFNIRLHYWHAFWKITDGLINKLAYQ